MAWLWRGRLWAGLLGTTIAFGLAHGQGGKEAPSGPPKVGDMVTLPFQDGKERQFKVTKVEKQEDGSYLSELKDVKTGETITLYDKPPSPGTQEMPKGKDQPSPKAKPKTNDPLVPPATQDKSSTSTSKSKSNTTTSPAPMPDNQDTKKPGLLSRIFGPKKPAQPTSASTQNTAAPSTSMPPPVKPTPGSMTGQPGSTSEPPRVPPGQPSAPPIPLFPMPTTPIVPQAQPVAPATPRPIPTPQAPPAPMVPGLPSIPIPPGGTSSTTPLVTQARYLSPAAAAMVQDLQPYVTTLRTASLPSERIVAVQSLGNCRHASTDAVKAILFAVCEKDPCPLVRACSIDELCKLGYFHPDFLAYLKDAQNDPSEDVRTSAKLALRKMTPQR